MSQSPLADLGRSQFFSIFMQFSAIIMSDNRLAPPGFGPPSEILDPLLVLHVQQILESEPDLDLPCRLSDLQS